MKIEINGRTIELHMTFRACINYENVTGKPFGLNNTSSFIYFFYATVMACDPELSIEVDDFIAWMDKDPNIFPKFCKWYLDWEKRNAALRGESTEPVGETSNESKKKE